MNLILQDSYLTPAGDLCIEVNHNYKLGPLSLIKSDKRYLFSRIWYEYPDMSIVTNKSLISELDIIKANVDKNSLLIPEPIISPDNRETSHYSLSGVFTPPSTFLFVSCSQSDDTSAIDKSFNLKTNTIRISNNKKGLSEVYNSYICEENRGKYVVFVHDDVYLDDGFVEEKLQEAHKKFDIVGIAGCISPKIQSPALWHLMADRKDLRGFCSHVFPDGTTNMASFGNSKEEVDMIDGVFMSVDVSALLDADCKFDPEFDFHFYDLAFCCRAKRCGLTLGVWPIFIRHLGLGQPDERWKELEPRFIEKYGK